MTEVRRRSLRQRLLVGLVAAILVYSAVIAWLTIHDGVDEIYELFDVHLAQTGLALLRVTDPDEFDFVGLPQAVELPDLQKIFSEWPELPERLDRAKKMLTLQGVRDHMDGHAVVIGSIQAMHSQYERNLRYQVWGKDGQLMLRSANAPSAVMSPLDGLSQSTDAQGQTWRHFGVWDRHHDYRVVVSEDYDLRNRLVRSIALKVASPLVFGLPVLIVLIWFSIKRGLKPLNVLTGEIEARKPDNLAPLDEVHVPKEVLPMVVSLNGLLRRMSDSLEGERRFTANAAHELRTPLAAIQAQVYAVRSAESEAERARNLDHLQRGVERSIRLMEQLLSLARLDPHQSLPNPTRFDVGEVVQNVCADLAPKALQRDQTLDLSVQPELPLLSGNADMVSMLVSNLVDNAMRYTQSGGSIFVQVAQQGQSLAVIVTDDGPGIPEAQRERVFERFFRLAHQEQSGTGLGLSICQRIAELHNASVRLGDAPLGQGTTARVEFPLPPV